MIARPRVGSAGRADADGVTANRLSAPRAERIAAIDRLRGIVILLMVVDHVRFFLSDARFDPTDPTRTTVGLFITRWMTHLCAPAFMLLAGAGAYLSLGRGRDRPGLSRFLLTRGLWLILLELTVARLGWSFNLDYRYASALVFWALGWSMIALAGLIRLPPVAAGVLAIGMILGHDLFDAVAPARWGGWAWLWTVLHVPGPVQIGPVRFDVWYPLVPWIGVMAGGYLLGPILARPAGTRDRILLQIGLALAAGFVVLRAINAYGDPAAWTTQATPVRTALSFLNTTKYPPSLLFLLMTLGPALAAMPLLGRWQGWLADAVRMFGRVPLFFWLLHVPLIHGVAAALSFVRYGEVIPWLVVNPPADPPADYGYELPVVYGVSLAVIAVLYPACAWFVAVKRRRRDPWLSYL